MKSNRKQQIMSRGYGVKTVPLCHYHFPSVSSGKSDTSLSVEWQSPDLTPGGIGSSKCGFLDKAWWPLIGFQCVHLAVDKSFKQRPLVAFFTGGWWNETSSFTDQYPRKKIELIFLWNVFATSQIKFRDHNLYWSSGALDSNLQLLVC